MPYRMLRPSVKDPLFSDAARRLRNACDIEHHGAWCMDCEEPIWWQRPWISRTVGVYMQGGCYCSIWEVTTRHWLRIIRDLCDVCGDPCKSMHPHVTDDGEVLCDTCTQDAEEQERENRWDA